MSSSSLDCISGLGEEFVTFSLGFYKANIHNVSANLISSNSVVHESWRILYHL